VYIQRRDENNDLLVKVGGWGVLLCVCCNALPSPMIGVLARFAVLCYAVLRQLDSTDAPRMCLDVRAVGTCGAVQQLILLCQQHAETFAETLPVGKGPFPVGDGNFTALFSTPMTALLHPQDILLFSLVIGRVSGLNTLGNQPVREFELSVPTA
jgi:hypothetical protein